MLQKSFCRETKKKNSITIKWLFILYLINRSFKEYRRDPDIEVCSADISMLLFYV